MCKGVARAPRLALRLLEAVWVQGWLCGLCWWLQSFAAAAVAWMGFVHHWASALPYPSQHTHPSCLPFLQVCKYIDMPLQHMSNLTLLAMNRPPRAHTEALLTKLRERIPGLALRTTFISGFPGESAEQHRELVDFVKAFRRVGRLVGGLAVWHGSGMKA